MQDILTVKVEIRGDPTSIYSGLIKLGVQIYRMVEISKLLSARKVPVIGKDVIVSIEDDAETASALFSIINDVHTLGETLSAIDDSKALAGDGIKEFLGEEEFKSMRRIYPRVGSQDFSLMELYKPYITFLGGSQ